MKTQNLKFLALSLLLAVTGSINALAQELIGNHYWVGDVQYEIKSINQSAKTGTAYVSSNNLSESTTELTLASSVKSNVEGTISSVYYKAEVTFTITGVSTNAFDKLDQLATINIPATVEEIEEGAFNNCGALKNVNFAAASQLTTLGDYVFGNTGVETLDLSNCSKLDLSGSNPFVNVGTGVNRQLTSVTLPAEIETIGTAFANCETLATLDLSGTKVYTLEEGALANTKALKKVVIPCSVDPTVTTCKIGKNAFNGSGLEEIVINGYIVNDGDFDPLAFAGAKALKKVTFNGNLGAKAIPADAFKDSKLTTLIVNGELFGADAIGKDAFKGQTTLVDIQLNGNLNATGAVAEDAFSGAGNANTTLKVGTIKQPAAIAAGAFDGATIKEATFNDLLVSGAIAANQFDGADLTTVNFQKEIAVEDAIGENAFTDTGLKTVNFNAPISVKDAIKASAEDKSPFAASRIDPKKTINFNGNVVEGGVGEFAFSNSNANKINLSNDAKFEDGAFAANSFVGIPAADVTYKPLTVNAGRPFDQEAFNPIFVDPDIRFVTTEDVKFEYMVAVSPDETPYRVKFIMPINIDVTAALGGGYYGIFAPQDEQYIIEKTQTNGATVRVYSAYYDDKTINKNGAEGDLYMNPLRVQDNGKYVINKGHTVIINSSTADPVEAYQDEVGYFGGVQTFSGLNAFQCNDLRYAPWTMNAAAIANGDKDFYGNVVKDYKTYRMPDVATYGFGFGKTSQFPGENIYILATNVKSERESYSSNNPWEIGEGLKSWYDRYHEALTALAAAESADEALTQEEQDVKDKKAELEDAQADYETAQAAEASAKSDAETADAAYEAGVTVLETAQVALWGNGTEEAPEAGSALDTYNAAYDALYGATGDAENPEAGSAAADLKAAEAALEAAQAQKAEIDALWSADALNGKALTDVPTEDMTEYGYSATDTWNDILTAEANAVSTAEAALDSSDPSSAQSVYDAAVTALTAADVTALRTNITNATTALYGAGDETDPEDGSLLAEKNAKDQAYTDAQADTADAKTTRDNLQAELNDLIDNLEGLPAAARLNVIWNDGSDAQVTGIMEAVVSTDAKTAAKSEAIYNLQGVQVKKAQKGIFIQNGKKIVVD